MINPRTGNLMAMTWKSGEILEIDHDGKVHKLKRGLTSLDGIDDDSVSTRELTAKRSADSKPA